MSAVSQTDHLRILREFAELKQTCCPDFDKLAQHVFDNKESFAEGMVGKTHSLFQGRSSSITRNNSLYQKVKKMECPEEFLYIIHTLFSPRTAHALVGDVKNMPMMLDSVTYEPYYIARYRLDVGL